MRPGPEAEALLSAELALRLLDWVWVGGWGTGASKVGGCWLAVGFCSTDCSHAMGVRSWTEGRFVRNGSLFVLHDAINAPPFI